jgi:hypothetical protein
LDAPDELDGAGAASAGLLGALDATDGAGTALSLGALDAPGEAAAPDAALSLGALDAADGMVTALSLGAEGAGPLPDPDGRGWSLEGNAGGVGNAAIADPGPGDGVDGGTCGRSSGTGIGRAVGAAPGAGANSPVFSAGAVEGLSLDRAPPLDRPGVPEEVDLAGAPVAPVCVSRNGTATRGAAAGPGGVAALGGSAAAGDRAMPLEGPGEGDGEGGGGSRRAIWDSALRAGGAICGLSRSGARPGEVTGGGDWRCGAGDGLSGPAGAVDSSEAAWGRSPVGGAVSVGGGRSTAPVASAPVSAAGTGSTLPEPG